MSVRRIWSLISGLPSESAFMLRVAQLEEQEAAREKRQPATDEEIAAVVPRGPPPIEPDAHPEETS